MNKEIFEMKIDQTKFGNKEELVNMVDSLDTQSQESKIEYYNEQLTSLMNDLVNLHKKRVQLIKEIETEEWEDQAIVDKETKTVPTKIKKNQSRITSFGKEREKLEKEQQQISATAQKIKSNLRDSEKKLIYIQTELKVKQKQREDLLIFKTKSSKNKLNCKVDEEIVKKNRVKSSEALIKKLKKLSKKKYHYTEKDKVIYNQLGEIEGKQDAYHNQVSTIKDNKKAVTRHLKKCDRKIEALSEDYFHNFKTQFFEYFKIFEPGFVMQADLINISQNKFT